MYFKLSFMMAVIMLTLIRWAQTTDNEIDTGLETPCTCGIFLSGQFKWKSKDQPTGNAALQQELDRTYTKGPIGIRQCTNKCLETIVKHLPNSPAIICATIDRDCYKEKAYLFIKNGSPAWHNTKLSAGREYCCKENIHYKCPL